VSNAFRILNQNPQFFTIDGEVLAGGSLTFSESGTSTPADTYNGPDLGTANANPVVLDSSGRASTDIWGDTNYRVVLKDALGAVQWTRDNVEIPGGGGTSIPSLVSGEFLTNDGTVLSWAEIRQVPDPSGQNNKVLGTDGTSITWVAKPSNGSDGTPGTNAAVTASDDSYLIGNGTSGDDLAYMQFGDDSAPASGGHTASKSVTFPASFKDAPRIFVEVSGSGFASAGYLVMHAITVSSATGFTVVFNTNSSDGGNGNIISSLPFYWAAFGTKAG
jgi:hypothetical protein